MTETANHDAGRDQYRQRRASFLFRSFVGLSDHSAGTSPMDDWSANARLTMNRATRFTSVVVKSSGSVRCARTADRNGSWYSMNWVRAETVRSQHLPS